MNGRHGMRQIHSQILFYLFAAILVFAALRVITARNPVHAALFLVLAFFTAAGLWLLLEAEFLAIALVLVYVGAVMVLFLFVVMMLDINLDALREGFWNYLPWPGWRVALIMVAEMAVVLGGRRFGLLDVAGTGRPAAGLQQHQGAGAAALYRLRLSVRTGRGDPAGGDRGRDRADAAPAARIEVPGSGDAQVAACARKDRLRIVTMASEEADQRGRSRGKGMIGPLGATCITWSWARSCSPSAWSASSSTART